MKPAYIIFKELLEINKANAKTYLWEGERLSQLKQSNWQGIADHIETLGDFAKEYGKSVGHINQIIKVYEVYGDHIDRENPPSFRKLYKALPLIKDDVSAKKWIDNALNMTGFDFDNEVRVKQGKPSQDDCKHEWVKLKKCKKCKKVVYDEKH